MTTDKQPPKEKPKKGVKKSLKKCPEGKKFCDECHFFSIEHKSYFCDHPKWGE